jgi:FeS assembly SUF system protein
MEKQTFTDEQLKAIREKVIEQIRMVYDPEIPVNIYDLGLIYAVELDSQASVDITMTLTSPMCPVAETLPLDVQSRAGAVKEVGEVNVNLVWEPPWTMDMMSEDAKLELGF